MVITKLYKPRQYMNYEMPSARFKWISAVARVPEVQRSVKTFIFSPFERDTRIMEIILDLRNSHSLVGFELVSRTKTRNKDRERYAM